MTTYDALKDVIAEINHETAFLINELPSEEEMVETHMKRAQETRNKKDHNDYMRTLKYYQQSFKTYRDTIQKKVYKLSYLLQQLDAVDEDESFCKEE